MTTPSPRNPLIAPSILAANFGSLTAEIQEVERGGADLLHIDVMDGKFVPPITFGDNMVALAKKSSKLFLDVHLMIESPENHLASFATAGAGRIIVHQETCSHLHRTLTAISSLGVRAGVAVNPATPVQTVFEVLGVCDLVLVMTVNPGWGGQPFIESMLPKIGALRAEIDRIKRPVHVEVDGGINKESAKKCFSAGADVFVAGSSIFGSSDRKAAIELIRAGATL